MKNKYSFLLLLVILQGSCSQPTYITLDKSNKPYFELTPPVQYVAERSKYEPIELANDCISVDSLFSFYDSASNIIAEFEINDKSGRTCYFGGTSERNKNIWCYLVDSVNGSIYPLKDYRISEYVQKFNSRNAIGIVLDHSGSMGEDRATILQNAVYDLVCQKDKDDGLLVVKFDYKSNVEVPLSTDKNVLKSTFRKNGLTDYGGGTALNNSIALAVERLSPVDNFDNKVIFLFTDGMENSSSISKEAVISMAKSNNIKIFAIGFGHNIDNEYLQAVASGTNGKYYHIYQTVEFQSIFDEIYNQLLIKPLKYRIEYKPKDVLGEHFLKMKICLDECSVSMTTKPVEAIIKENEALILNEKFKYDKAVLDGVSEKEINMVANYLKRNPRVRIRLEGHTDCRGDKVHNQELSANRANSVKTALVKKGINGDRIETKGFGSEIPYIITASDNKVYGYLPAGTVLTCEYISGVETNDKRENAHSLNRRTQMVVIQK